MSHGAVLDVSSDGYDFEPIEVPGIGPAVLDGVGYGLVHPLSGGPDELDDLVSVIAHEGLLG
jgi:hypothetical protein